MVSHSETYIYGYAFDTEDDVNWVIEQITVKIQTLGGIVKCSKDNVYISLPSGIEPKQVAPLHFLDFTVMIF
jgi:hypothetical protein